MLRRTFIGMLLAFVATFKTDAQVRHMVRRRRTRPIAPPTNVGVKLK